MSCISEDADVSSAGRRCHHSAPELGHTWESEEKSGTRAAWVGGLRGIRLHGLLCLNVSLYRGNGKSSELNQSPNSSMKKKEKRDPVLFSVKSPARKTLQ